MKDGSKKIALFIFMVCFTFIYGCVPNIYGTYKPAKEYNTLEVETYIANTDERFKTPGFKGIHLGMDYDQVNEVIRNTPWGYKYKTHSETATMRDETWPDEAQHKSSNFIKGDESHAGAIWCKIGCDGPNGKGGCYWIRDVSIDFYNAKLINIKLTSPKWTADKINTRVQAWGEFALRGLIKKYGAPSKIYEPFCKMNIFSFKPGYNVSMYIWNIGKEKIILSVVEYESKFGCSISFQNPYEVHNAREHRDKGVTEF